MPNFRSANWLGSIAELQALDMTGSDDGVWVRTATGTPGDGLNWFDIGTTINWFDIGTTIDWFDFAGAGGTGVSSENWIGWTWRKNATEGLAATGGGYWIPANNGTITFEGGGAGGGLDEAAVLAIAEGAIADRLPLNWTLDINAKPATYPPSIHNHVFADVAGVAPLVHTHVVADITNISSWLSAQTIDFGQIINVVFPDSDVTSVNGEVGDIIITSASLGAAELVHNHTHAEILDWDTGVLDIIGLNFQTLLSSSSFNWDNIINFPFSISNFLSFSQAFDTGFVFKEGSDTLITVNSQALIDISELNGVNAPSGHLFFDGENIVLTPEPGNDQDLLSQIAVMVSAAWEQVKEEVTFGKIPNRNFIHLH